MPITRQKSSTMKFELFKSDKSGKFYFRLKAKNGQVILQSQGYTSKGGAKNGIESVKENCMDNNCYEKKVASNGKHHFNLLSTNKQIVGSSQMYASRSSMSAGIRAVKRVAPKATLVDVTE
jgi:uncharacterized protein YegP (UPF0339 family)